MYIINNKIKGQTENRKIVQTKAQYPLCIEILKIHNKLTNIQIGN